jgi:hypothetical protein
MKGWRELIGRRVGFKDDLDAIEKGHAEICAHSPVVFECGIVDTSWRVD